MISSNDGKSQPHVLVRYMVIRTGLSGCRELIILYSGIEADEYRARNKQKLQQ